MASSFIHPTAVIYENVFIDKENVYIGAYSVIGGRPEHRNYWHEDSKQGVIIKSGARIFEHITIHGGTLNPTIINQNAAIFNKTHIAHDVHVHKNAIIGGGCLIAGHCEIMEGANISGGSRLIPHVKMHPFSFLGAASLLISNIPIGEKWFGSPAKRLTGKFGINHIGLERAGLTYEAALEKFKSGGEHVVRSIFP